MPELLELVTSDVAVDLGMACSHDAGEPLIEKMLHDQAVCWIDDPAKHQCGGAGDDACFRQVVVVRDQPQRDAGRDHSKPCNKCGNQHEFDVSVGGDSEQPLGRCRIELLLTEHRVVEPRQRLGNDGREFDGNRSGLDAVAFAMKS